MLLMPWNQKLQANIYENVRLIPYKDKYYLDYFFRIFFYTII
jgi:hypothetical protein